MVFETKKINIETLGEYLKAVRAAFKLKLKEVSEATGVNPRLLETLEEGKMQGLPADVYVVGALTKLAKFYNLNEDELLLQYKKERLIASHITGKSSPAVMQIANFWKQLVITPKVLFLLGAGLFIFFTVLYLFWQVSAINRSPDLEIISPKNQEIIKSLSVKVAGQTDRGAAVSVNGQGIFVDNQGKFSTNLSLVPGVQEINVLAKNRFGKESKKNVRVIIESPTNSESKLLKVELKFLGNAVLKFSKDNEAALEKTFTANENLVLEAKEKVEIISLSDGGAVSATVNGQSVGVLAKSGVALSGITFSSETSGSQER